MEIVQWFFIGIFLLSLFFGIKQLFYWLVLLKRESGIKFSVYVGLIIALICSEALIREYSPHYRGIALWISGFMIVIPIFLRRGSSD